MAISNMHNLMTMNTEKISSVNKSAEAKMTEKLTSDSKAGRAEDIAASLEISKRMRRQLSGTNRSAQTAQEGKSFLQTVDSTLEKVSKMRHQVNGLSMKAVGDTGSGSDRQAIQQEINQLLSEINRIRSSTRFNPQSIFKAADAERDGAEIVKNANNNILQQPAQSILAQADRQPDLVLQLLQ